MRFSLSGLPLTGTGIDLHPIAWGMIRCNARQEGGASFERRADGTLWQRAGHYCLAMQGCENAGVEHRFSDKEWPEEQVIEEATR